MYTANPSEIQTTTRALIKKPTTNNIMTLYGWLGEKRQNPALNSAQTNCILQEKNQRTRLLNKIR
jgi:hypothetical protein